MFQKKIISNQMIKYSISGGLEGPIFYFEKRSWSALTSCIHIKCFRFMKKSNLLGHFGTLTMRSVFRNTLVNGIYVINQEQLFQINHINMG